MADFRSLHDDHHPADARQEQANANAAVDAFPAAPGPIPAFVPAKGWSLSLPQELVADIMERAVREMRAESGVSAAARTVARLSRACPDFYAAAPAGWAAAAEGCYAGNDGDGDVPWPWDEDVVRERNKARAVQYDEDVPSSMLVHPHSHSLPALRAACAAAGVPATTKLSKAHAILALLDAHGLAAPLRAPVPSGLIRRVYEERGWPADDLLVRLQPADVSQRALTVAATRAVGITRRRSLPPTWHGLKLALADAGMSASRLVYNARQVDARPCAKARCYNHTSRECRNFMCRLHCPGCLWVRHGGR